MPLWLWLVVLATLAGVAAYRQMRESRAIKRRGAEIEAERLQRRRTSHTED